MHRRQFLSAMGGAVAAAGAPAKRPNIVIILADDLGYSDIGCFGSEIETPNLDRLAARGIRFTQMYNAARCCPSRAALLTGLYQHQAGVGGMVQDQKRPAYRGFLNENCVTIAEALKAVGYRTLMSGKWHVGEERPHWPVDRGFDRYFGLISGASSYWQVDPGRTLALDGNAIRPDRPDFYMTDAFTDHAVQFLDDRKPGQPFLLYLAYTAPHWPLHAPWREIHKYRNVYRRGWDELRFRRYKRMIALGVVEPRWPLSPRDRESRPWTDTQDRDWQARRMAVYAAQVDRMDQGIGRVLQKVRQIGEADNTLVIFMADNGACAERIDLGFRNLQGKVKTSEGDIVDYGNVPSIWPGAANTFASYGLSWANASNTPFRRFKADVHEGGIATPFIAAWANGIGARGRIVPQVGHVIDLMPTCLEVAGAPYPPSVRGRPIAPLEGQSLVPAFRGEPFARKAPLFWEHLGNRAVRDGDWKLVASKGKLWELYDLAADRTELHDLASKDPERAAALASEYDAWAKRCGVLSDEELRSSASRAATHRTRQASEAAK